MDKFTMKYFFTPEKQFCFTLKIEVFSILKKKKLTNYSVLRNDSGTKRQL